MSTYADWALPYDAVPTILLAVLSLALAVTLIWLARKDLQEMILPNVVTYPLIVVGAVSCPLLWEDWALHLVMGLIGGGFFYVLAFVKMRGAYVMGMGDAKLYMALAFIFGIAFMPLVVLSQIIGLLVALTMRAKLGNKIPHGPHICVAALIMLLAAWL